ncbi:Phosphoglycerate kinase [Acidilobus saccharovorans 345-15]|uniref:Phosphoglycerate kinase n=1 Tax=Acidilobus saccharovorans (strain DSM 16705 / JCM 18335 / VKM B-2471 / 345-15) TaxID=666510 RepID=D9PZ05_ACIS3|nr:phosphoglycerate kinase [Acidilobus saccharovorans]ADL19792.1 Phosphoglycerate kinase [Acidilobus saccharovorans 345-15]
MSLLIQLGDQLIPTLDDLRPRNSKVLVRVDFNSPVNDSGMLMDDSRIRAHLQTVRELVDEGNSVVLMSHQGRPGGRDFVSLSQHAKVLSRYLGVEVKFIEDVMGPYARQSIRSLGQGEVAMLENVRFASEELVESPPRQQANTFLVRYLSPLFNYYVNDAFATAHRSQPSVVGFPLVLPSAAGRLMESEVRALAKVLDRSLGPKVFVLGGAKVADTLKVIENLVRNRLADRILTGGLVGELFAVAKGVMLSIQSMEALERSGALALLPRARRILMSGAPIEVPMDYRVMAGGEVREEPLGRVSGLIMDIGSGTVEVYSSMIEDAGLTVIRGPMGVVELPQFREGTMAVLRAAMEGKGYTVIGGGHVAALSGLEPGASNSRVHVSTGAAAFLAFLSGEGLPALEALSQSAKGVRA